MTRVPVACVLALLVAGCVSNKIDVVESGVRPDLRARGLAFAPESQGAGPMAKTLQEHVKATIAPYKYPRAIAFVTSLPKTPTGKLQRFALREMARAEAADKP